MDERTGFVQALKRHSLRESKDNDRQAVDEVRVAA
jgi:hypothetical protein